MVPTQFVRLLRLPEEVRRRYDLSSLRLVVHGSAPVAPDTKRAMIEWLGPVLFEFYGGTEGGGVSIDSQHLARRTRGRSASPARASASRSATTTAQPVATGVEGQVWFHDGARSSTRTTPRRPPERCSGDWFTLGDIGYLDDDGYLYLCDRRADVIISGGVNVYPAQIEAVLLAHPAVADCCVVGVPDDEWGESVRAVVQPAPRSGPDDELADALLAHCRAGLAGYQVPRAVDFDADLPRTETGKLARRLVRERYWIDRPRRI